MMIMYSEDRILELRRKRLRKKGFSIIISYVYVAADYLLNQFCHILYRILQNCLPTVQKFIYFE